MIEFLEFMFRSFWHFVGMGLILSGATTLVKVLCVRLMRMLNIHKHGWPPIHCDADGDLLELQYDDERDDENALN